MQPLRRGLLLAVALASALVAPRAGADPLRLDRREAARRGAEEASPVVLARREQAVAARARQDVPTLTYQPRVTIYAGGRRFAGGGGGAEYGVQALEELPGRDLAGARRRVAEAEAAVKGASAELAAFDGAKVAVEAFDEAVLAEAVLALRKVAEGDATALEAQVAARVSRGLLPPEEGALAAAESAEARLATLDAEGMATERLFALRKAIGVPATAALALVPPPEGVAPLPSVPRIRDEHPALRVAAQAVSREGRERDAAVAAAATTWGLGATYMREGTGEQTVIASVQLPIPVVDPTRFARAQGDARVVAREGEAALAREGLERELAVATHECEHLREREHLLAGEALPRLREATRLARAQVERGTRDLPSYLVLRRRLLAAEEALVAARASIRAADAHLRHVAGIPEP